MRPGTHNPRAERKEAAHGRQETRAEGHAPGWKVRQRPEWGRGRVRFGRNGFRRHVRRGGLEVRGPEGARLFHDRIAELKRSNPFAAAVDVHSAEEYAHCRLFLTGNGRAGFALADGDMLVSVFSYRGEHAGDDIVAKAVEQGARRLDCYNIRGGLPRLYGRHGFKPVATVDWNDDYAPDGWDYGTFGRPDVMAMAVTDDTPEPVGHVDYDTAVRLAADVARGGRRSDA